MWQTVPHIFWKKIMKIAIGIATTGTVKTKTLFSVVQLVKKFPNSNLVVWEGCNVHQSRENIVMEALKSNCTHILFIDSDMLFEANVVHELLKRDRDIIGVDTNLRKLPLTSTVKTTDEQGNLIKNDQPDGTIEVYAVGTGFMLIKLDVFKKLKHPWFMMEHDDKGNMLVGSDMWFCRLARRSGYKIYCDSTVKVGHIGDYVY